MIDNRFLLADLLGVGGSSKVYSANTATGQEVAVKIIRKDKGYSDKLSQRLIQVESYIMKVLGHHPNLVNCLYSNAEGNVILADGEHSIRYLVMEKCKNGSLANLIKQTGSLEEEQARVLFIQL